MGKSTTPRHPLSKRLRFQVLERDGFTCRYCGAKPPDGALHADHIIPVSDGGKDTLDNLITACEPCNSGKGSRSIGAAQPLPDMSALAAEALATTAVIAKWRKAHKQRENTVSLAAQQIRDQHDVSMPLLVLSRAIREYGIAEVDYAVDRTCERVDGGDYRAQVSYMYAVLRNRRTDQDAPAPMPTFVKPAKAIASESCPWGGSCHNDLKKWCALENEDGLTTACSFIVEAMGGWDTPHSHDAVWECADFVDHWREGTGARWVVRAAANLYKWRDRAIMAGWVE